MSKVYSLLGSAKYVKLRSLNFLPMPSRRAMELHILRDPQIEEGIEVTEHSLSLLEEVFNSNSILFVLNVRILFIIEADVIIFSQYGTTWPSTI